jgi:tRNA1(Val) A37 N6-methylase TrmN6
MAAPEPRVCSSGETLDAFLDGRLMVLQPEGGYRAGLDAVLLAAVVPRKGRDDARVRIADLGAGVGTAGLCVASADPAVEMVLVEREPVLAGLARRNVEANGLAARVRVVTADLEAPTAALQALGLTPEAFTHVLANPPYQVAGDGRAPPDPLKAASHIMPAGGIERWLRTMTRLTAPGGTATMIHRTEALPEVLAAFAQRFGALTLLPVHPRAGEAAGRIIVTGRKGSRAGMRLLPGLVVHEATSAAFTPNLRAILRDGAGLDLWSADAPTLVPREST